MPIATGTALAIAGIASAGGAVASSVIGAHAAGKASEAQTKAAETSQAMFAPFQEAGGGAAMQLSGLLQPGGKLTQPWTEKFVAPTADTLKLDPGYEFRLEEGQKALDRSAAARGGVLTGGTVKATERYAQGMASQEYQNAYNRALTEYQQSYGIFEQNQSNLYNRLMGLTDVGLRGAGGTATAATQAGAARASGYVGRANAWQGGISGIAGAARDYMTLQQLFGAGGGGGGTNWQIPGYNPDYALAG